MPGSSTQSRSALDARYAHELENLLAVIAGHSQVLDGLVHTSEARAHVEMIRKAVDAGKAILDRSGGRLP